jgi:putative tryptophan/tyrosine transport system substrate-binding protein
VRRREFITLLGGAAATWPLSARAQQATMPVIGYLGGASPELYADRLRVFHQGLNETGYVEQRNVAIEFRWAGNHFDRLPALASDLVRRQVAVIAVPGSTPGARAAKAVTMTIPIVFAIGSDPVELGLVASMNRPGGNLTGVSNLTVELMPKRLELLHEVVPTRPIVALLVNQTSPNVADSESRHLQEASRKLGLQLQVLDASTKSEIDTAFATLASRGAAGALVVGGDAFLFSQREQIVALAAHHSMPAIYDRREYAAAGGLMSYGASLLDVHRQVGVYTGRILKGEKPADLPVLQPTRFELVINVTTAKALGLHVPPTLLARADEVIE